MMRNHHREGSTAAMSNAVDGLKRQVKCDYVAQLKEWGRCLAEAAELDAE